MSRLRLIFVAPLLIACVLRAAINTPEEQPPPFTAKELHQGYRERVILARPHSGRSAEADAAEAREGVRVRERISRFRDLRIIDLDDADGADRAIARLQATGRYEFVEPDYLRQINAEPNDPQFINGALWGLKNTGQAAGVVGADIKAPAAWDIIREAPNVIVAVVDTGINTNHQDIIGNLWRNPAPTFGDTYGARFLNGAQSGSPTDDNGHGTHVAGTIGAVGDNGLGVAGVAWKVQIMAVKVFPASGGGSVSDIARGVNYAIARGAQIINASYGAIGNTGFSNTEFAAISAARDAGVIFVAAAGNAGANMDVSRFYPASHALDNIVTVGNSTRRDELALSSNYGGAVDLFAPGSEIVSLSYANNTGVATMSGTSMAAPHVTGALALLKAYFPSDSYRQLINRLLRGAESGDRFLSKAQTGGRLNLLAALNTTSNRPFNDTFTARARFNSVNLALRSNNTGATADPGEPAHANVPSATTSLWWEWTSPTANEVSIDTSGSSYDTVLAVYTGTILDQLTPVAANDNDSGKTTSRVTFTAKAGTTYQIAVAGKNGASGLTLLNLGTTPANDAFASPVILQGISTHLQATNSRCTVEAGEPRISGYAGGTSLWYRWTAPRSGRFQISAVSSDFDPIVAVYTGTSLSGLAPVDPALNSGANDKSNGATWTINATAGMTYAIAVDSKTASGVGQFTVSLTDSRWQFQATDAITGAPAVGRDGKIYFGSTDRVIYALNQDGTLNWSYTTGGMIDTASPAVADDGAVYVGANDGTVYAFNPDGSVKWTRALGSTIPASNSITLAADGTLYLKGGDGYLYALAPSDGSTRWRFNLNGPTTYASAAVAPDGTIYQGSEDKNLYAINPNGTLKWAFAADNDIYTVPAIDAAGNLYFAVLNTGKLFSVSAAGKLRWSYAGASLGCSSSPVLSPDGKTVYFGGYDKKLHAVDTATGLSRWVFQLGDEVRASSPAVDASGVVYIGCYDACLYAINPDGTLNRTYDMGHWIRSSPAIFGNNLYIGSNDRKVYAFDLPNGSASGPWPQYRHNSRRTGRQVVERLQTITAPANQVAVLGQPWALTVVASGEGPLTYQWTCNGSPIAGATSSTYAVAKATAADAGSYAVTIAGPQGTVTAGPALVTTEEPDPGRLTNLSVRTTAGTGTQTMILGFFAAGEKSLLIRGIGPSLAPFGVTGTLADPRLRVIGSSSNELAANDDWSLAANAANVASTSTAVGAFALATGSKDSALLITLPTGSYTAQITGPGTTTGIALAEIYDAQPKQPANRLMNASARAQVGVGGSILIAGFTLSGNLPTKVLIRGIGPSLSAYGVTGVLANPRLEVYRGAEKVFENDDWGGTAALTTAFQQAGAFALPTASSRDAALLLNLPAGSYTAQVSGVNATTGVALVEIYEVP